MNTFVFRSLNISTITINVESNIFFNLDSLVSTFMEIDSKEDQIMVRSRKILNEKKELPQVEYRKQIHPPGTISYICYKNEWKGIRKKKKRSQTKKRNDFVNQVTLDIFVENSRRVNVMLFRNGKIKLAGCKNSNDAVGALLRIWDLLKNRSAVIKKEETIVFVFINEMINISFSLPFIINKIEINKLFNKTEECISFYEQTGQQYVNIKMASDGDKKKAVKLELTSQSSVPKISVVDVNIKKPMKTCFMLFDKRVIMSGVDYLVMENHFGKFKKMFEDNIRIIRIC